MLSKLRKHYFKSEQPIDRIDYYNELLDRHQDPAKAVGWFSQYTQRLRFINLALIADLEGARVCDVGSGLGDLFGYFQEQEIDLDYLGIDNCPRMVNLARENHPGVAFKIADFRTFNPESPFDYILASGVLSHRQRNPKKYFLESVRILFSMADKGLAFNVLSDQAPLHMRYPKDFDYFSPGWVLGELQKITPYVSLYHHYLPNDFTVHMYSV